MGIYSPDVRVTLFNPLKTAVVALDASADMSGGYAEVNDTPMGCDVGTFVLGKYREDLIAAGRWSQWQIVEVSAAEALVAQALTTNFAPASDSLNTTYWNQFSNGGGTASIGANGPGGATSLDIVGTGPNINCVWGAYFNVTPGQTITFSLWANPANIGNLTMQFLTFTWGTPIQSSSPVGTGLAIGTSSGRSTAQRYSISYTVPGGVYTLWASIYGNTTLATGNRFSMSQPMIEVASSASAWYVPYAPQNLAPDPDNMGTASWNATSGSVTRSTTAGPTGGPAWTYTGTGSFSNVGVENTAAPIAVVAGQTYTISAFVDATYATATGGEIYAYPSTGGNTAVCGIPVGFKGRVWGTWTAPAGCTSVILLISTNGATVATGQLWVVAQPMVTAGTQALASYMVAAPTAAQRVYVDTNAPFDTSRGEDTQQAYLWDQTTLTMRLPVSGIGTDAASSEPYITVNPPLSGGGNPGAIAAYAVGTLVGARRYVGCVMKRDPGADKNPETTITTTGLAIRLQRTVVSVTISTTASVDSGLAMLTVLQNSSARWPMLNIDTGTFPTTKFPTVGQQYSGTITDQGIDQVVADILLAACSNGDVWVLRIGHDYTPRMVKVFTQSSNTYTYPVTMAQNVYDFIPLQLEVTDDATNEYNSVKVTGDTDPVTSQPVSAIAQDATSIALYGQLDQTPISNTKLKANAACGVQASALVVQNGISQQTIAFRVYTRNDDTTVINQPAGSPRGIVVRGMSAVTITGMDDYGVVRNMIADSEFTTYSVLTSPWTNAGLSFSAGVGGNGPTGNALYYTGTGSASGTHYAQSQTVPVIPGQVLTLSCSVNASSVTAGSPRVSLVDGTHLVNIGAITQTAGVNGTISGTFTVPTGCFLVYVNLETNNCTITNGAELYFSEPQLEPGSYSTTYAANNATVPVYGLVTNVKTRWNPDRDAYQDVSVTPIIPNWNAAIAEVANASQAAIMANTVTGAKVDQYCVSAAAFPKATDGTLNLSVTGFVVTAPVFLALFAQGTAPISAGGNTFTLTASATNYVWLNPNNTWTVQTTYSLVTGAILFAVFTTSTTACLGQFAKAPIGVITLATIQQPVMPAGASFTAGSISAVNLEHGNPLAITGAMVPFVSITFTIAESNTPAMTNWSHSLIPFSRLHGGTTWGQLETLPKQGVGNGSVCTVNFFAAPGDYYDFGVAVQDSQGNQTAVVTLETNYGVPQWGGTGAPPTGGTGGVPINRVRYGISTPFNAQASIPPYTTNAVFHASNSGVSPNITMKWWIDNGTSATNATFWRCDGSSVTAAYDGTSGSPAGTQSGLASSDTMYFLAVYNPNTSAWTITPQKNTNFTQAQVAAALGDGFVALLATASGNGVSAGGGGGSIIGCPEADEPIECRRDGEILTLRARDLIVGDELRDFNPGEWNRINRCGVHPAVIYCVDFCEIERPVKVDASHLFWGFEKDAGWLNVAALRIGDRIARGGGGALTVASVRSLGHGTMMHIECDRMRYLFNETSSHNGKSQ